jgi:hypothetical protein
LFIYPTVTQFCVRSKLFSGRRTYRRPSYVAAE